MYGIYQPANNIKMRYMRTMCWLIYNVLAIKCCRLGYEYISQMMKEKMQLKEFSNYHPMGTATLIPSLCKKFVAMLFGT